MANVQAQFLLFHDTIKLKRFKENETLREKRDIIRRKLRDRLPTVFAAHNEATPGFEFEDQGSYEMETGVRPVAGDYDIDQGLYFAIGTNDYPDPVALKQRVHEALDGHTKKVEIRRSCVTVFYQREGEGLYHVDLAIYADGSEESDGKARLAKGKANSNAEHRVWEVSDPQGLAETILGRFEGDDRRQFRRIVRYLKRWRDEQFDNAGHAAPIGIGLTVAAYNDFAPAFADLVSLARDDLKALRDLVRAVLGRFQLVWDAGEQQFVRRLVVTLPVEPQSDLFARMTNKQMEAFEDELETLRDALDVAVDAVDPIEACKELRKVFGDDFPVPDPADTAKKHAMPAIVSSSSSA